MRALDLINLTSYHFLFFLLLVLEHYPTMSHKLLKISNFWHISHLLWNPATVSRVNAEREELIEAVREYVANKRKDILEEVT